MRGQRGQALVLLHVFRADVLPLFLETKSAPHLTMGVEAPRTPLFQLSQNFVMPRSKPMLNANAPAKIVGTKTPVETGQPSPGSRFFGADSLLRRTMVLYSVLVN